MIKKNIYIKKILNILIFLILIKIYKYIFFNNINIIYYWKILFYIHLINKFIEFPLIFITYILLNIYIFFNTKKKKNINTLILLTIIQILSLITKYYIKKIFFIKRPYKIIKNIMIKKNNITIPYWLINNWKKKNDSSFPSGHTIFSSFWIIFFLKQNKYIHNKIIIYILKIIIISRILFYLHRIEDIIISILINILFINITKYLKKKIKF